MSVGEYNKVIWYYQLSWYNKLATGKSLKADVSSVSPLLITLKRGVILETLALKLLMVANLHYQLSW